MALKDVFCLKMTVFGGNGCHFEPSRLVVQVTTRATTRAGVVIHVVDNVFKVISHKNILFWLAQWPLKALVLAENDCFCRNVLA